MTPKASTAYRSDPVFDFTPARRLWLGDEQAVNATRLFRRAFRLPAARPVRSARLHLFADCQYLLWVNGELLGRGPTFFHPHRRPVASYDLAGRLHPGANVIAVLVHSMGIATHNYTPSDCPGLVARLDVRFRTGSPLTVASDAAWRATDRTGWHSDTPRRSWAIGFVERYDAAAAPHGWQSADFDDSRWPAAEVHPHFRPGAEGVYLASHVPSLRFGWEPARQFMAVRAIPPSEPPVRAENACGVYAAALMAERWSRPRHARVEGRPDAAGGGWSLLGLQPREGIVVALDPGREWVGHVGFDLECDSAGTIDVAWAEAWEKGRPQVLRKGNSYADRFHARPGRNEWLPHQFSAGRYLCLVFRGFRGTVRVRRVGVRVSEPDLCTGAHFECERPVLNAVWRACERTIRIGTQEGLMDCPTREQAAYVGDGNPTAKWLGALTGDYTHWRALVRETFAVQGPDGQVKSVVFSGMRHILLDYSLLAIVGARDYYRETGDRQTVRDILPACRRLIGWFRSRRRADGLFDLPWETMTREASFVSAPASAADALRAPGYTIFIDHPGMGWHNQGDPGIDRRGLNAGINALFAIALRALAELDDAAGRSGAGLRREAEAVARAGRRSFWNGARGLFADGVLDGAQLPQLSQQTNTWAVAAGFCPAGDGPAVLRRTLDPRDRKMARSGPYFWTYMFTDLARAGLARDALREAERLWGDMLARGATSVWETFAGDHLDSFCHPWSCAPVDFLLRHVAGIGPLPAGSRQVTLTPQIGLLRAVRAQTASPRGAVSIAWTRARGGVTTLEGELPAGVAGRLTLPGGRRRTVTGSWTLTIRT